MSAFDYFKFEYRMNRRQFGVIDSLIRAIRTAIKPTPF